LSYFYNQQLITVYSPDHWCQLWLTPLQKKNILKGNTALEGHVLELGYFGLKKFVDPDFLSKCCSFKNSIIEWLMKKIKIQWKLWPPGIWILSRSMAEPTFLVVYVGKITYISYQTNRFRHTTTQNSNSRRSQLGFRWVFIFFHQSSDDEVS
jgi:hypothetical protein